MKFIHKVTKILTKFQYTFRISHVVIISLMRAICFGPVWVKGKFCIYTNSRSNEVMNIAALIAHKSDSSNYNYK